MPRAQQNKVYNTFIKGLITEAGPLTFPENASTDEENCELFAKGNRRRRLGMDLEDSSVLSTQSVELDAWKDYAISSNKWETVGGDGGLNFLVLQVGAILYFYNLATVPLSRGQKTFTIDLNDFKVEGVTNVEREVVSVTSGKGLLFVSGTKIESFFVEYTPTLDTNPPLLDLSSGAYIGDMSSGGGLAAAFDKDNDQPRSACAIGPNSVNKAYVGIDFGVGVTKKIAIIKTFGSNDFGYKESTVNPIEIKVFGSLSLPSDSLNGTLLGNTGSFTDGDTVQEKIFTIVDTTAYRYVWATVHDSVTTVGKGHQIAEVQIFEQTSIPEDFITTTQIDIEIRDFEGVDDALEPDEEPVSLSDEHNYNLKNQGWVSPGGSVADPVAAYFTSQSKYPPNSKQWWTAKNATDDFDAPTLTKFFTGKTLAPKGHYILEAFNKDRNTVSGGTGITTEVITERPRSVAFFAGRIWWAGVSGSKINGNIYFNQILEGTTNIGRCYSINDPTSEDLNSLLSSDGGVIVIPEVGHIRVLFSMKSALIILADNGVWSITGAADGGSFKATDFIISRISGIGLDGPQSIVDVEGTPVWWGKTGINTVSQNEINDKFGIVNLSKDTIQTFYEEIPSLSKIDAVGNYDQISKKVFWLYRSIAASDEQNRFRFDKILVLDTRLGAFIPGGISTFPSSPYYIGGGFNTSVIGSATENSNVVDGVNSVIDGIDNVIDADSVIVGSRTFVKYLVFTEGITEARWSFGGFINTEFKDWVSVDGVGVDYLSFFETGDELMQDVQREKQATYVHVFFNRTELAYEDLSYETWIRPSGCFMQAQWDWSDHSNSAKFSPKVQVYRFVKRVNDVVLDGIDIVMDGVDQVFASNTYLPDSGTDFNSGLPVTVTKNKVRGNGKALKLRFESETGKDFDLLGWAINFSGNTTV